MEKLYQYAWMHRLAGQVFPLRGGGTARVIDPGRLNSDSGPDFFNAKIDIDGTIWAGDVEIHVRASDWHRHGHQHDRAYDRVILHAVGVDDTAITRSDSSEIPQITLTLPEKFHLTYARLSEGIADNTMQTVPCGQTLSSLPQLTLTDWLETLAVERIQAKGSRVAATLEATGGDWEQTCFITLARALGFGLNSDPFERLARSLPLKIIHHHSDNPQHTEALLFGQAGMLDTSLHILDEYYQYLAREYFFLARKYGLRPLPPGSWKYARTRPQNFPHRRIAWLASLIRPGFALLSRILDTNGDITALRELFTGEVSEYWRTHSSFDVEGSSQGTSLGKGSVDLLMINAVAPIFYACGSMRGDCDMAERGLNILESLDAENNTITRRWKSLGLEARNAMRSQAMIQLTREYCEARKCLYCRIGHHLLRRTGIQAQGAI